jgi:hypothetical protein
MRRGEVSAGTSASGSSQAGSVLLLAALSLPSGSVPVAASWRLSAARSSFPHGSAPGAPPLAQRRSIEDPRSVKREDAQRDAVMVLREPAAFGQLDEPRAAFTFRERHETGAHLRMAPWELCRHQLGRDRAPAHHPGNRVRKRVVVVHPGDCALHGGELALGGHRCQPLDAGPREPNGLSGVV